MKLIKYPKKPKASASVESLERWLKRCNEIDKENTARKKKEAHRKALLSKVRNKK